MNPLQGTSGDEDAPTGALVLGGGGPVGASWMSALLDGLMSEGLPVAKCDVVMGTSAGSVVGAWLTMQPDGLRSVPERMRERAAWHAANAGAGRGDRNLLQSMGDTAGKGTGSALSTAQAAVAAMPPISADQARGLWQPFLPEGKWPRRLQIVAVDAGTGTARAWSAQDDIPLTVAVSCSTAAPGVAPPVAVADAIWVDGGVRSGTNADLLVNSGGDSGHDGVVPGAAAGKVLIVAPLPSDDIAREEAILVGRGHDVRVVIADRFYQKPTDMIDPRFIDIATAAGTRQARDVAADLGKWWSQ
ncbi:patatin-like phospholipase family protein [Kutzneria kofuensis]|uniref:NTE family protein n=1 Tax=Kutzneria kofuensis TaxID=103725 RepID=A0A7W9NG80_9PSEU|nr:patatin-like phospholipase family protein [Kutzneria kofuensis]MBB5891395.1 NTE family protein [Kutzneria kofuensis]